MNDINYFRGGDGPPLVLLHGVGHHWQAWRPVIDRLTADFDVIGCDSPGFGRSAPLPKGVAPTIPAYAGAFAAFFAALGIRRPHVAGNSMGGAIALELARQGVVASVTAFSPAGLKQMADDVRLLAEKEGLTAHAASVDARLQPKARPAP